MSQIIVYAICATKPTLKDRYLVKIHKGFALLAVVPLLAACGGGKGFTASDSLIIEGEDNIKGTVKIDEITNPIPKDILKEEGITGRWVELNINNNDGSSEFKASTLRFYDENDTEYRCERALDEIRPIIDANRNSASQIMRMMYDQALESLEDGFVPAGETETVSMFCPEDMPNEFTRGEVQDSGARVLATVAKSEG